MSFRDFLNEAPQYERMILKWTKEADKEWSNTRFQNPGLALESAMGNAMDTEGVEHGTKEFWRIAYDSIQETSWFTDDPECQKWFKKRGYKW